MTILGQIDPTTASLWLAVVGSGLYHGLNPGMGWPLAVSAGLMGNGRRDLVRALGPLALGHVVAMAAVLLPFAVTLTLVAWEREIRIGAGVLVMTVGLGLLLQRRHPRFLARIRPTRLALWSFAIAMVHGAGLMLLPAFLGLCRGGDGGQAMADLVSANMATAGAVAVVHAVAMVGAGGAVAFTVHEWLGLGFLSKCWLNLDTVWAVSLVVAGAAGVLSC